MGFHCRRVVAPLVALAGVLLLGAACGDNLGRVRDPEIEVSPTELSFSQVIMGDQDTQTVTIRNTGEDALVITDLHIDANTSDLQAGFEFADRLEVAAGDSLNLDIIWAPTSDAVRADGSLIIVSNDRDEPTIEVPIVTPPLAPVLVVEPAPIDFGLVAESTTNNETIRITNRGTAPAIIQAPEGETDAMFVTGSADFTAPGIADITFPFTLDVYVPEDPSRQSSLTLEVIYAPQSPGSDDGHLIINYNALGGDAQDVELTGVAGQPGLTVAPNPIDFGQRPLALTSHENVTVTNTGVLQVSVDRIYFDGSTSGEFAFQDLRPEFATSGAPLPLSVNQSLSFIVQFTPSAETTYVGQVVIEYFDQGDPTLKSQTVTVVGVGVDNRCPVAVPRGFIRDDPQQRRAAQIDWATPTDVLILDGTGSFDPDGEIVSYEWEMTRAPDGTTTVMRPLDSDPGNDALRQFFVPLSGRYDFTLRVFDDIGFQDCDDPAVVTVLSLPDEAIHIELTWHNPLDPDETDDQGSDADLHIVKIGHNWFDQVYDAYYANKEPDWSPELPSLDIDDTDGGGPENIQMDNPVDCQWYAIGVHYFEEQFGTAYATVRIYIDSEQIAEFINRPLESTDDFWDVGRLQWPTGEFFPVDEIYPNFDRSSATPPQVSPDMEAAVAGGVCN